MKILVTGGAGFIGSNLTLSLQEKGYEVDVIDNMFSGSPENLKGFRGELIKADISSLKFKDKKFDVIFHQAAITDTTYADDREMLRVNIEGFKNVLNYAKLTKTKIIYASSAGVYGRGNLPMKENQELSPLNSYSLSKKIIDEITKEEIKKGDIVIIGLRYFNVYGPKEKYKKKSASMIYQLYKQMKERKPPRIFKWGEQKRDFIYVNDVIEANLKAMELNTSCIINVGTGVSTSFNRIVEILNKVLGTNYEPEYFDNPYDFYQNETQADTSLAYKMLGFKPHFSIEEGINDYVSYLEKEE